MQIAIKKFLLLFCHLCNYVIIMKKNNRKTGKNMLFDPCLYSYFVMGY